MKNILEYIKEELDKIDPNEAPDGGFSPMDDGDQFLGTADDDIKKLVILQKRFKKKAAEQYVAAIYASSEEENEEANTEFFRCAFLNDFLGMMISGSLFDHFAVWGDMDYLGVRDGWGIVGANASDEESGERYLSLAKRMLSISGED